MIHEIGEGRYNPTYYNIKAKASDFAINIRKANVLLKAINKQVVIPTFEDIRELFTNSFEEKLDTAYFLFSIDEKPYFSYELTSEEAENIKEYDSAEQCIEEVDNTEDQAIYFYINIHRLRDIKPVEVVFASVTASHIMSWKRSRQYCGVCGEKAIESETERAMICPKCHSAEYPKICPAVIVAIKNQDDKLLLVRNKLGNYHKLALVSGFVEIGESFEDAVRREVFEEVGLKVKNIKFYSSQPWGFSLSEMIGYVAEVDGDDTITLQESELSEGGWYTREETPNHAFGLSIGNEMLHKFKIGEI